MVVLSVVVGVVTVTASWSEVGTRVNHSPEKYGE
jgi:hypothetical protein